MGLHGRSKACSICPAEKTLKTGEPHDVVDFSSYKKNWVLRSYPVRDEHGAISGVVEIVTDITERRKAEEAMRQSEQKFRELFENANDMIFLLDFKGKILSCNTAAARTYGYEPEQMHGTKPGRAPRPRVSDGREGHVPEKAARTSSPTRRSS